jgi:hypothetical protein
MVDKELFGRLVAAIEEGLQPKARPNLRVVQNDGLFLAPSMCELERESHRKMIRHIRRRWGHAMQQVIDQACFGLAGLEQLDDDALVQLHKDLERAQDCIRDGVSFEDAGILRSRYG